MRTRKQMARGFTLIEVMIVIAIILALTGLIGVAVLGRRDEAKKGTAQIDMNTIKAALDMFRLDYDRYPTDEEGLAVLWDKSKLDPEADAAKWAKDGYLKQPMPNDRWQSPWGYRQQSERSEDASKYDLWSFGPDKQEGTEDDINSWTELEGEGGATGVPAATGG